MGVKKKSLNSFFWRYTLQICVNTLLILFFLILSILILSSAGVILPANYAEVQLQKQEDIFENADHITKEMIPVHCTYGVYAEDGRWLYGDFPAEIKKEAWECYRADRKYAEDGGYYRFIKRHNGENCIVKYRLRVYFTGNHPGLNRLRMENIIPVVFVVLFFLEIGISARAFSKKLQKRMKILNEATEKISNNDLDFEKKHSDIKEIEEIMESIDRLKTALKKSLEEQWETEIQREEELSALTHDIKTPVTIIRGNAELLMEESLTGEEMECTGVILKNIGQIEMYLESMRKVIHNGTQKEEQKILKGEELCDDFIKQAEEIAIAADTKVHIKKGNTNCLIKGSKRGLLRAWENIVGNAVFYTDKEKGIDISVDIKEKEGEIFLVGIVRDYGEGFSKEALRHGTERFYKGDRSRHDREHQGLGLYIASNKIKEQGGQLFLKNIEKIGGACVELWVCIYN